MSATPLQTLPWYWRFIHRIQGTLDTQGEQILATAGIGVLFLVVVWVIYLGGRPLKRRFADELVEVARTLTLMVVALAFAALVVVIWRVVEEVWLALGRFTDTFQVGTETAVLLFVAFITLLGTYTLTRITKRAIRLWSDSGRISPHQRELAHHAVQLALFFLAVAFIFTLFNWDPRDLFLGAGVLGVVLGFAARKTLSDVLAGFVILFGRPFEAGDWIAVGDRQGIVTEITIFNTQVKTFDEEHVLIPNDSVTNRELINYSKTQQLRLNTEVGIDYDADVAEAATVATEAMESCDSVVDNPSPDVVLESFADSAVVVRLRYWIDQPTIQRKLSAQNEIIDAVKSAFEEEGIKIPYPQRELLGREETDGLRIAGDMGAPGEDAVPAADRVVEPTDGEAEPAVRRVRTTSETTAVEEPVEERYGGDGDVDEDGSTADEDGTNTDEDGTNTDEDGADDTTGDGEPTDGVEPADGQASDVDEASADDRVTDANEDPADETRDDGDDEDDAATEPERDGR